MCVWGGSSQVAVALLGADVLALGKISTEEEDDDEEETVGHV